MWSREELKMRGKMAMKGNRGACIAVSLVSGIISFLFSSGSSAGNGSGEMFDYYLHPRITAMIITVAAVLTIVGIILKIAVEYALKVGAAKFYIRNQMNFQPEFGTVFDGFRSGQYGNIVFVSFMRDLYIALWSLLLIVPGIIKTFEYYMVPYILAENPGMDKKAALAISKQMMAGEKWNTFVLEFSFIGWQILNIFTFGILGIVFINPYMDATRAELYAYCKEKAYQQGFIR